MGSGGDVMKGPALDRTRFEGFVEMRRQNEGSSVADRTYAEPAEPFRATSWTSNFDRARSRKNGSKSPGTDRDPTRTHASGRTFRWNRETDDVDAMATAPLRRLSP